MTTISASDARQTLPAQLDKVERGEEVAITRHGKVVAVLVHPDALGKHRSLQIWKEADEIGARLEAARTAPLAEPSISAERAEELIAEVRESRAE